MSRLETALRSARSGGRKLLVPYLTGGYPDRDTFVRVLEAFQEAGADAAEVGLPFSDPSADGPVIQRASECALAGGATTASVFADVAAARARGVHIPLLVMTYYNPVLAAGGERFAAEAAQAGLDGVLVVDLPAEEAAEFTPLARAAELDTVMLVAPTTPEVRLPTALWGCSGFVYCVSVTGVTGDKRPLADTVGGLVARVRRHTDLPALVGFGVSDPASAGAMARLADGVIVGSALIGALGDATGAAAAERARAFIGSLRAALDAP